MIVGALAVDDLIFIIADTAAGLMIGVGVEGAEKRSDAFSFVERQSVAALALAVDIGLV